jgi:hypothetical protein
MKPAESMANMVSRLQTLKLVLKQPEPASVFKFLDAIRPKTLADKVRDILRIKEMDSNEWTVKEVGDIAIRLEKAQGEESLWTSSKPTASGGPCAMCNGSSAKNATVTCYKCGRIGPWYRNSSLFLLTFPNLRFYELVSEIHQKIVKNSLFFHKSRISPKTILKTLKR